MHSGACSERLAGVKACLLDMAACTMCMSSMEIMQRLFEHLVSWSSMSLRRNAGSDDECLRGKNAK